MPTYEYQCLECGHTFEAFQRMSDEPLSQCPQCDGEVKRKIGTGAGLLFKGSGFYETDYKKSNQQTSKTGGKSKTENASSSETKKTKSED